MSQVSIRSLVTWDSPNRNDVKNHDLELRRSRINSGKFERPDSFAAGRDVKHIAVSDGDVCNVKKA